MQFELMNFIKNLGYMGKGMLAIGIVMGAIILVTMGFNALSNKLAEKSEHKDN